jgi:hypothetical protein
MQEAGFIREVSGRDLGRAEDPGDAGDAGQSERAPLPRRERHAIGARGDEAQQAEILLLVVPQQPTHEHHDDGVGDDRPEPLEPGD